MFVSAETARALERLHVRAWPAVETEQIDGWLWRWSGGASQRANSVSTIDFTGHDPARTLDRVEARYRARKAPSRVHTFDVGQPATLPELLSARGYQPGETTLTMMAPARPRQPPDDIEVLDDPSSEWLAVYLGAITEDRRFVNQQILRHVPNPRAFFQVRRDGRVISTALGVLHDGKAVAECVATQRDARGHRGAEIAMRGLMAWAVSLGAHVVGLQVVETNQSARALYRRLEFLEVGTNRFWVRS